MLFVDNRGVADARVNLALEEYVFRQKVSDETAASGRPSILCSHTPSAGTILYESLRV
jgi:hypothetical protein